MQPVNGVPQGSYEPATFLVTPKKQQIISVKTDYKLDDKTILLTEVAASSYNVNSFSAKDKSNDNGLAAKLSLQRTLQQLIFKRQTTITAKGGYEYVHKNFKPIERLRTPEFFRDWGLPLILTTPATEQLPFLSLHAHDNNGNIFNYNFSAYLRGDGYKGYRNIVENTYTAGGWQWRGVFNLTNISTPYQQGHYLRPSAELGKTLYKLASIQVGGGYTLEHNELRYKGTGILTPESFSFYTLSAFVRTNQAKPNRYAFTYFTRTNQTILGKNFTPADQSQNYNLQADFLKNIKHQLRLNITYRTLSVNSLQGNTDLPGNSLLGRVEYAINEWKGLVSGNALYELGSGQEQRRDYTYIEVQAGRGEYTWNDYNTDGIQQLNEFETALYADQAKYIRIYTPTNVYIKANYTQLNYSITINPRAVIKMSTTHPFLNLLSRFTLQSSLQTFTRQASDGSTAFNPFKRNIADTALINLSYTTGNTLSFNRASPVWGADVTHVTNAGKSLLTYGAESRKLQEWNARARLNIARKYTIETIQKTGTNNLFTPAFNNRNYNISTYSAEQKLSYTYLTRLRLLLSYQYVNKKNGAQYGNEKTNIQNIYAETRLNAVNNTSLSTRITFSKINYTGSTGTTISYIMLDGLLPGNNLLWNAELNKRILNNLELTIRYEGRKPAATRTIHTGQVGLRALL